MNIKPKIRLKLVPSDESNPPGCNDCYFQRKACDPMTRQCMVREPSGKWLYRTFKEVKPNGD